MNSFGLFAVMAIALLLLVCFASSAVYADGAAGEMPAPPQPAPPSGGDGDTTLTDVIVTVLGFII
jgi:hypothetical protein